MKSSPQRKAQPKQQPPAKPQQQNLKIQSQITQVKPTTIAKPPPEPEKPKENLKLKHLKEQWSSFQLDTDLKKGIEEIFKDQAEPLKINVKSGKSIINPPIENFNQVIQKQKAKLKKAEFEEGLTHMRIKNNLLSKKEWEDKRKFIENNMTDLALKDKEIEKQLGLNVYFTQKNQIITDLTLQNIKANDKKTNKDSPNKQSKPLIRPKSQSQFQLQPEELKKHEEFIQKIKEQEKQRKKLMKQLKKAQEDKQRLKELNEKQKKEKNDQDTEKQNERKMKGLQEENEKKEKERQEMKEKQNQVI